MADNISIKDGAAATVVIAAKDVSSVYVPASTPVTPANVTMVGTAGSAAAGVMTVQGIASGTVIPVTGLGTAATPSAAFTSVQVPRLLKTSVNFTIAAGSSHTANDNLSDNGTAGSVTKLSWSIAATAGVIRRVRIRKSDQTVATPTIRLWLWDTTFTVASGDDAVFSQPLQDTIGFVDVVVTSAGTDDAVGWSNSDIPFSAATVFGLLQTLTTFTTAASEVFTIDLWYDPR